MTKRTRFGLLLLVSLFSGCQSGGPGPGDGPPQEDASGDQPEDSWIPSDVDAEGGEPPDDAGLGEEDGKQATGDAAMEDAQAEAGSEIDAGMVSMDAGEGLDADADQSAESDANDAAAADSGSDADVNWQPEACSALQPGGQMQRQRWTNIRWLGRSDTRILSLDYGGTWTLWDAATAAEIASGLAHNAALAGNTLLVLNKTTLELRDATNGSLLASINVNTPVETHELYRNAGALASLSPDGSYVWVDLSTSTRVWSRTGEMWWEGQGAGSWPPRGASFATNQALYFTTTSKLERVLLPSGTRETVNNIGNCTMFLDGTGCYTRTQDVVQLYALSGQPLRVLSEEWFWGAVSGHYLAGDDSVGLFAFGATAPLANVSPRNYLRAPDAFYAPDRTGFTLYKRAGTTYQAERHELGPWRATDSSDLAFAMSPDERWAMESEVEGTFFDSARVGASGAMIPFGCGAVRSLAGNRNGRLLVVQAMGPTLLYDVNARALLGRIDHSPGVAPTSDTRGRLSDDGLRAAMVVDGNVVSLFHLPEGTVERTWTHPSNAPIQARALAFSGDGTRLAWHWCESGGCKVRVVAADGSSDLSIERGSISLDALALSPNGQRLAVGSDKNTYIYENGVLAGATAGIPKTWLDDDTLIVARRYDLATTDRLGNTLTSSLFPYSISGGAVSVLGGGDLLVSSAYYNETAVHRLGQSSPLWRLERFPQGDVGGSSVSAAAGDFIVYASEGAIWAEEFR